MHREIAFYVDENGSTTSLDQKGKIIIYRKRYGKWQVAREKPFAFDQPLGIRELREKMNEVKAFLGDCKIFAGLSVVGVPYFELEKANCSIWELAGRPGDYCENILQQEQERLKQEIREKKQEPVVEPVHKGDGCYEISLTEIQQQNLGLTTKQALLPFLRKGRFYSLEVTCQHVPLWLEGELSAGNYAQQVEQTMAGEIKILINKKMCHEC